MSNTVLKTLSVLGWASAVLSQHVPTTGPRFHIRTRDFNMTDINKPMTSGCQLKRAVPASPEVIPSFVAAYPGSGSSLMRSLIPALTGLESGNTRNLDFKGKVSIKTHFPHRAGGTNMEPFLSDINRVVLVLRNPMGAIPSFANFQYEKRNELTIHSTQATTEEWINWRNKMFATELKSWVDIVRYWMESDNVVDRHVIAFEDVTSETDGPRVSAELAAFFARSPGVDPIGAETIPCVWRKVVKYDDPTTVGGQHQGSKRKNRVEREFSQAQIQSMIMELQKLTKRYAERADIKRILKNYIMEMNMKLQLLKDRQTSHSS